MVRQDFILCKTRNLLAAFLAPLMSRTDRPRQRFLRQSIGAILLAGTLIISDLARWIHDDCTDIFYRVKRLLNHLISPEGDLTAAVTAYRQAMARQIEPDTPLIIDLTDLAKPRARKMKYLALVRDGSEHKLVAGYWCVEVYAWLAKKRILPLALDVFSIEDPLIGSQNLQIDRTIRSVHEAIGGHGVWVADRGFDGLNCYETWFSLHSHFVVRQRGDRMVVLNNGVRILECDLVERLRQIQAQQGLQTEIVFCPVRLPEHDRPLYLVGSWIAGIEDPLILLTTLCVETLEQARQVIRYYRRRWSGEEAGRFLKSRVGFETFRIRRYEAIQRLAWLAMLAMGFLTWVLLHGSRLAPRLFRFTSHFRKQVPFIYYRLLDGLQEWARLDRLRSGQLLLSPP
jgi:hypothetical protein